MANSRKTSTVSASSRGPVAPVTVTVWAGDIFPDHLDAVGTAARFGVIGALATGDDELWVADLGNHVIRRAELATAQVTTLIGTPFTSGTLRTDTVTFGFVLLGTIILVGALLFLPAAVLGPVAEHLGPMPFGR